LTCFAQPAAVSLLEVEHNFEISDDAVSGHEMSFMATMGKTITKIGKNHNIYELLYVYIYFLKINSNGKHECMGWNLKKTITGMTLKLSIIC